MAPRLTVYSFKNKLTSDKSKENKNFNISKTKSKINTREISFLSKWNRNSEYIRIYGLKNREEEIAKLNTIFNFNVQDSETKNQLNEIKQKITNKLQIHQTDLIQSNRKLVFYSLFKTYKRESVHLNLVRNTQHRQSL